MVSSLKDIDDGVVDNLHFNGNTMEVRLNNGRTIKALAIKEQIMDASQGKTKVLLGKTINTNNWVVRSCYYSISQKLKIAAEQNDIKTVKDLLFKDVDLNSEGVNAFISATANGHTEIVQRVK